MEIIGLRDGNKSPETRFNKCIYAHSSKTEQAFEKINNNDTSPISLHYQTHHTQHMHMHHTSPHTNIRTYNFAL